MVVAGFEGFDRHSEGVEGFFFGVEEVFRYSARCVARANWWRASRSFWCRGFVASAGFCTCCDGGAPVTRSRKCAAIRSPRGIRYEPSDCCWLCGNFPACRARAMVDFATPQTSAAWAIVNKRSSMTATLAPEQERENATPATPPQRGWSRYRVSFTLRRCYRNDFMPVAVTSTNVSRDIITLTGAPRIPAMTRLLVEWA